MPAQSPKRWTAAEARELNAKNPSHWPRYEVIDGELLVTPAPRPFVLDLPAFFGDVFGDG